MCCKVGFVVETTLGEQGDALSVWAWGSLVGASKDVGVGSEMHGIEVRGRVIMEVKVGGVHDTTLGAEVGGVDVTILGAGTGDGI